MREWAAAACSDRPRRQAISRRPAHDGNRVGSERELLRKNSWNQGMNASRLAPVAALLPLLILTLPPALADEPAAPFPPSTKDVGKSDILPPKEAAKACLRTADEMVRGGYRKEAIALYERARELDPKQQQVCRYLAVLYDISGMDSQALAEYNHAVRLNPKDAALFNDFGYFYYHRHDMHQAEQWFRAAIALAHARRAGLGESGNDLGRARALRRQLRSLCESRQRRRRPFQRRHDPGAARPARPSRTGLPHSPRARSQPRSARAVLAFLEKPPAAAPPSAPAQSPAPADSRPR